MEDPRADKVRLSTAAPGDSYPPLAGPRVRGAGQRCGVSPGRDVGGEGGTLIGVDELGGPCDVLPLGLVGSPCHRHRQGWGTISRGRRGAYTPG